MSSDHRSNTEHPQSSSIDVIIPAYNEAANLPALVEALPWQAVRQFILCDNGSTDQTATLAREAGLIVVGAPQRGYGSACLAGIAHLRESDAPPDILAFLDADLSDDPAMLGALCKPIVDGEVDLVIGSRVAQAERGALTLPQRVGNAVACRMIRLFTGHRYTDLGPMRAIRWKSLQALDMQDTTWGWTVEMQFKAARLGLRVREIDVPYRRRHAGKSKISGSITGSVRAGWKIITTIFTLWWRLPRPRDGYSGTTR